MDSITCISWHIYLSSFLTRIKMQNYKSIDESNKVVNSLVLAIMPSPKLSLRNFLADDA